MHLENSLNKIPTGSLSYFSIFITYNNVSNITLVTITLVKQK